MRVFFKQTHINESVELTTYLGHILLLYTFFINHRDMSIIHSYIGLSKYIADLVVIGIFLKIKSK